MMWGLSVGGTAVMVAVAAFAWAVLRRQHRDRTQAPDDGGQR
jgi:nitrogen fixation-related uncharacterized protein